eukprot:Blabericola_migrator_1__13473@NODE_975_length_5850_cov_137_254885_g662_i1_p1_GENE_NODE_975_length_5850_cov_137_254885_g662_i1NODE_975_length_5850_cov_137_254885_g662_i1_p1_ORF_typecomplete_len678_score78_57_NODE_975_length_5850_cov_137_254885_g662_i126634696
MNSFLNETTKRSSDLNRRTSSEQMDGGEGDQHTGLTIWNEYGRDSLLLDDSSTPNSWTYMTAAPPPFGCSNSLLNGVDGQFDTRSPPATDPLSSKFNDMRFQDKFTLSPNHFIDPASNKLPGCTDQGSSYLDLYDAAASASSASGKLGVPSLVQNDLNNTLTHDLYQEMLFRSLNDPGPQVASDYHCKAPLGASDPLDHSLQGLDLDATSTKHTTATSRGDSTNRRAAARMSSNSLSSTNSGDASRKKSSKKVCGGSSAASSGASSSSSSKWTSGRRGTMNNKSYSSSLSKFTLQDESGKRKIRGDIMNIAESLPALPGLYFDKKQKGFRVRYQNVYVGWVALSRFPSIEEAYISAREIWENAKQHAEKFNTPHAAVMASLPLQKEAQAAGKNRGGRPRTVTQLPHAAGDWLSVYPTQASQPNNSSTSAWRSTTNMFTGNTEAARALTADHLQSGRRSNRLGKTLKSHSASTLNERHALLDFIQASEVADVLNTPELAEGLWSAAGYMRPEGLMGFGSDGLGLDPTAGASDPFSIYAEPGPINYMDAPGAVSYSQPVQDQFTAMGDLPELLGFDDTSMGAAAGHLSSIGENTACSNESDVLTLGDSRKRKNRPWEDWTDVTAASGAMPGTSGSLSPQGPLSKRRVSPLESNEHSPLDTLKDTPSTEAPSSALVKTEQ